MLIVVKLMAWELVQISCEVGLDQKGLASFLHQILDQSHSPWRVELDHAFCGGFFGAPCTKNAGFSWKKNHNKDGEGGGGCESCNWLKRRRRGRGGARGSQACYCFLQKLWLKKERSSFSETESNRGGRREKGCLCS